MTLTLPYGTFEAPDSDTFAAEVQEEGFWDTDLQPYFDRVQPGRVVIDVGAHVGYYSGYLASRGVKVLAFEGHPVYVPLLQANMQANGWERRVTIAPWFCYSTAAFLDEDREHAVRASNTWLPVNTLDPGIPLPRLALPLDAMTYYVTPSLLKIDAQGADLHVLLGAEQLIQRCHPPILIEYEAALATRHGHSADDYRAWRDTHGYEEPPINGWNAYWTWRG